MIKGIALLVSGVALYSLAGSVLSGELSRCRKECLRRPALLLLALDGPLALSCAGFGTYTLYRRLALPEHGLPLAALTAAGLAGLALVAGGAILAGAFPPRRRGGGPGPDDLPPPPDPDGPDGWAEFERAFRAYARREERARVLVR